MRILCAALFGFFLFGAIGALCGLHTTSNIDARAKVGDSEWRYLKIDTSPRASMGDEDANRYLEKYSRK